MTALRTARIQLEGALEVVERATQRLEAAASGFEAAAPKGLREAVALDAAPETRGAEVAVQRLAAAAPELVPVLARHRRAREALAAKLEERLEALGAAPLPPSAAVELVLAEPMVFSGWVVSRPFLAMTGLATAACLTMVLATGSPLPLVPLAWLGFWALIFNWPPIAWVAVTPRRMTLGHEVLLLEEIRAVRYSWWRKRYVVELSSGLERRLPSLPERLWRQLEALGVVVE